MSDLEVRIVSLEEKFSHQDELVFELNKIVANQQEVIVELIKEVRSLGQLSNQDGSSMSGLKDDVPPHY
ncbi:hypothetical protein A9Q84_13250 [Halobacteriovorax marinus]|uniref:SlyX protein n=1 Tax=Halobacteriovorax marinus TaxID=97084 RepID=A0A1Y5F8M3_9BACT|nr:hypothetical protein A9Q84_13250 [Halobacteriovorax marinus]